MYCFFNKFFFKVEILGNLPIFCHAHLVAIQNFVNREILFDRSSKCPMLCLFFYLKGTIGAVKSAAHVILNDLKPENLNDFETLVFDTAGKLISLMGLWAIKQNPKYGQRDGSLSLKGYGFVGREFVRLMDYCFYELKKNIVVVFHATEEKDGDNTRLRIKVEGQTKNNVWEPMDLGGFVEMYGNDRTIGFSNCEKYFAKGTRGIHGIYKIPALTPGSQNDFLTKLFEEYNSKAAEEVVANAKENEAYEQVMQEGSKIIAGIKDADTANAAMQPFKGLQHHLTSSRELNAMWKAKIAALGLAFDSNAVKYVPKSAEEAQ